MSFLLSEKLVHADLDERALDALKEFPVDGALTVLKQFVDSNLEHVSNKSAYLCGVMKTYRQKSKAQGTFLTRARVAVSETFALVGVGVGVKNDHT